MNSHWKILSFFSTVVLLLVLAYLSFGIPLACGTYGCIRATDAKAQRAYDDAFARSTATPAPSEQALLTTLMRRYLLTHAISSSRISVADVAQYRTDVLHVVDDSLVKGLGYVSLAEYDALVLVPFLTQQALMQERHLDAPSALYAQLAQEQWLVLLKPGYRWNRATGEVVAK